MKPRVPLTILSLAMIGSSFAQTQSAPNYLANNTILIVRHSEKPVTGNGLTLGGNYVRAFMQNTSSRSRKRGFPSPSIVCMPEPTRKAVFALD